ncbi:hypothetical protein D3C78_1904790 [compost metagenome]
MVFRLRKMPRWSLKVVTKMKLLNWLRILSNTSKLCQTIKAYLLGISGGKLNLVSKWPSL